MKKIISILSVAVFLLVSSMAFASTIDVSATIPVTLNFTTSGSLDWTGAADGSVSGNSSAATVDVTTNNSDMASLYLVTVGAGGTETMTGPGAAIIGYTVSVDGGGHTATSAVSGSFSVVGNISTAVTPSASGTYTDTLTVTVSF